MTEPVQLAAFRRQWEASRDGFHEAMERVGRSGWLILGGEVEAFERDLAAYWPAKHAVGVGNGLDALELVFRALGAEAGDVFLTTPLTAFATTLAILKVGGVPVFSDVDEDGLLDLDDAERVIGSLRKKPRFFVPVHLYGRSLDLARLEAFAKRHALILVEDCAQAIGAGFRGRRAGTAGIAAATSFYPTKNLGALGDGGAVLTNDAALAGRVRSLRDYGQTEKYVHDLVGLNSRLDELQAALLRTVQLPLLDAQTARRRTIAEAFLAGIRHRGLTLPRSRDGADSVWHLFPVLVNGDRRAFCDHLKSQGVATAIHYPRLVPHQKALQFASTSSPARTYPWGDRFARDEVSIPVHPFLTDVEVERVIAACNTWSAP